MTATERVRLWRKNNPSRYKQYSREYVIANRSKISARKKIYYAKNRVKLSEIRKRKYRLNRLKIIARTRNYRIRNAAKVARIQRFYRKNNKEKLRLYFRDLYKKKSVEIKERLKQYYIKNRGYVISRNMAWAKGNPNRLKHYRSTRRARIRGSIGKISSDIIQRLLSAQNGKCNYCKVRLNRAVPHLDHIMPIKLGGGHEDGNLQLTCRRCNQSKHAMHPEEFRIKYFPKWSPPCLLRK